MLLPRTDRGAVGARRRRSGRGGGGRQGGLEVATRDLETFGARRRRRGLTPAKLAKQEGHEDVARLLQELEARGDHGFGRLSRGMLDWPPTED